MKPLLIVSDSHKNVDDLIELFEKYNNYLIIHLGDYQISEDILLKYNVEFVRGNCDFFSKALNEKILNVDGKKIFITHGDKYRVKSSYTNIFYRALELEADYCLFGHTHIKTSFVEEGIQFLNPGSFKEEKSYITVEEDNINFHCSR